MKHLIGILILVSFALAQNSVPPSSRVEWKASAGGAAKDLPDGRTQKTVASSSATVSAIADVTNSRRFIDPPMEGGNQVAYVAIGIQNTSKETIHIDPSSISLRLLGKHEKNLKRLSEEQVIERAWQRNDRVGGAVPPMVGSMVGGGGAASVESAVTYQQLDTSQRRQQQASEQQTGPQAAKLKNKALLAGDLEPGKAVMGMLFFDPYEAKDKVELSVSVGETTFVIPFAGAKNKH